MRAPAVLIIALLAGCAAPTEAPEKKDAAPRPLGIGWVGGEWRLCDRDTCPTPTPKTVVPSVRAAPVAAAAVAPAKPAAPSQPSAQAPVPAAAPAKPVADRPAEQPAPDSVVVHFAFASQMPTPDGLRALEAALAQIRERGVARIEGYTDDLGTEAYNERLAGTRARFVLAWLKKRGAIRTAPILARGKCCYAAPNDTEEGRAANRRAVIVLGSQGTNLPTTTKENRT